MEVLSCHGGEGKEVEISEGSLLISAQTSAWQKAVEPLVDACHHLCDLCPNVSCHSAGLVKGGRSMLLLPF